MILYFSGTGNSEYTAKRIGKEIDDEVFNLFDKIRNRDFSDMHSERPWVVSVPTYAWRIPRIVEKWLENTRLKGNKDIYFVMTCGGSIGNAGKYLEKLCAEKKMNYCGCAGIVMPENYIALFSTPTEESALQIIEQAERVINDTAHVIKSCDKLVQSNISFGDKMNSGIVNGIFYPMFVHAKKFYATDACISCGKCAAVCPLNNVRLENGKPVWGGNCTHCMACICRCPKEAVEYGKHSHGLPRYTCKKQV
ncbi:EFR1 family ferrodoxin [Diplocloster agilis]|uniref:EFR1 family ferrodoxin n=1 Tax=Diplocloster agilis TaxID=2850323 RepID=UPI00082216EF|nr:MULTISPECIES: EFR1 family ferrodoxin [Lachnospiraceae]MBU9742838.1 EFR1 family ferrodoxin [Diplocloster agilis]MCU6734164.1 EFR1 family ferrodoxin [Suonthocola fibrivorans]SCJ27334.1 ferredoxin [uncultured Clostridium sp.]